MMTAELLVSRGHLFLTDVVAFFCISSHLNSGVLKKREGRLELVTG